MGIPLIKTGSVYWEGLFVAVYCTSMLSDKTKQDFRDLIRSWYTLGVYGAFGGAIHFMGKVWTEDQEMGFWVDMGAAGQEALDILLRCIEGLADVNNLTVEKIVLGMEEE